MTKQRTKYLYRGVISLLCILSFLIYFASKPSENLLLLQEQQNKLAKINAQILANSNQRALLSQEQEKLAEENTTLRKQRDELESQIATQMGLQTGGKATTPSTTMSGSAQAKPELN